MYQLPSQVYRFLSINTLPRKGTRVFNGTLNGIGWTFCRSRKRAATKLQNPKLIEIHFHTFRHWKATMLYYQTKDILYVKRFLGHKNIENTMLYIQIEEVIFRKTSDHFACRVAKTLGEAKELIEDGFEYVTDMDGYKLFRKRK